MVHEPWLYHLVILHVVYVLSSNIKLKTDLLQSHFVNKLHWYS